MIYAALLLGIFFGACGMAALLLILGANRPTAPTMHARRGMPPTRREPPSMPPCKQARDADFWDIAEQHESGRIAYRFLDIPYEDG